MKPMMRLCLEGEREKERKDLRLDFGGRWECEKDEL